MRICNELFNIEAIYDEDNNQIIAPYQNPFKNSFGSPEHQLYLESEYDKFFKKILEPDIQKTLMLSYFGNVKTIDIDKIQVIK